MSECMIQIKKDDKMLNGSKVGENFLACPFTSFCLVIILSCISNFERGQVKERERWGDRDMEECEEQERERERERE